MEKKVLNSIICHYSGVFRFFFWIFFYFIFDLHRYAATYHRDHDVSPIRIVLADGRYVARRDRYFDPYARRILRIGTTWLIMQWQMTHPPPLPLLPSFPCLLIPLQPCLLSLQNLFNRWFHLLLPRLDSHVNLNLHHLYGILISKDPIIWLFSWLP